MNHLKDLPNQAGYKFIGITHEGDRLECHVDKNSIGLHDVYDAAGNPCFCQLAGWDKPTCKQSLQVEPFSNS